ncbi:hypothetical protein H0H92_001650 [Tricholoma furcatifolium]|nr:hypothetical protein H0H92_001650 [Tricholoma furcatifolium]
MTALTSFCLAPLDSLELSLKISVPVKVGTVVIMDAINPKGPRISRIGIVAAHLTSQHAEYLKPEGKVLKRTYSRMPRIHFKGTRSPINKVRLFLVFTHHH